MNKFPIAILLLFITKNVLINNLPLEKEKLFSQVNLLYPISPQPIMYYVSKNINQSEVISRLDKISLDTCFIFKRQDNQLHSIGINFLLGTEINFILSSNINKPTTIWLDKESYKDDRIFYHYIGRALGLNPETSRYDRDNYIDILWQNINESYKLHYHYLKDSKNRVYHTSFDYGSVMLYDRFFGSINRNPTYKSKIYPFYDRMTSLTNYFSYNDLKILNNMYCSNKCKNVKNDCQNSGYLTNDCNDCKCPYGFYKNKCINNIDNHINCGNQNIFYPTRGKQFITNKLPGQCFYLISPKVNETLRITINYLRMSSEEDCRLKSGIEIKYRYDKGTTGFYLCGRYRNITISPIFSNVHIRYHAQSNSSKFKISFQYINKYSKKIRPKIY
uniref:Metalloendopeptidase n=1 Tax=Strongyloides stercoralis TaxID=6248 RepID=A0A0K0EIW4_STRER